MQFVQILSNPDTIRISYFLLSQGLFSVIPTPEPPQKLDKQHQIDKIHNIKQEPKVRQYLRFSKKNAEPFLTPHFSFNLLCNLSDFFFQLPNLVFQCIYT